MSRKSTVPKEWKKLIDTVGGIEAVCLALPMAQSTFYRATRGLVKWPADMDDALADLCKVYDVPNPLANAMAAQARSKDLRPLRMLGEALENGFPPATRTLAKLRMQYPEKQLVELAESDGAPETILRAVTALLEFSPDEESPRSTRKSRRPPVESRTR